MDTGIMLQIEEILLHELGDTHTDVIKNVKNCPFITLKENTSIPNLWYTEERPGDRFILTAGGFILESSDVVESKSTIEKEYDKLKTNRYKKK